MVKNLLETMQFIYIFEHDRKEKILTHLTLVIGLATLCATPLLYYFKLFIQTDIVLFADFRTYHWILSGLIISYLVFLFGVYNFILLLSRIYSSINGYKYAYLSFPDKLTGYCNGYLAHYANELNREHLTSMHFNELLQKQYCNAASNNHDVNNKRHQVLSASFPLALCSLIAGLFSYVLFIVVAA